MVLCFFFQAEDGIRDGHVTGVQTCALPILQVRVLRHERVRYGCPDQTTAPRTAPLPPQILPRSNEIGRASCRERVESSGVAGWSKEKTVSGRERESDEERGLGGETDTVTQI